MKWTYKVERFFWDGKTTTDFEAWLNVRGQDGWELVRASGSYPRGLADNWICVFKK